MKRLLNIYHGLPAPVWPLVASFRALSLKRRRYGSIYRAALPEIRSRLTWEKTRWEAFQKAQLAEILNQASVTVPIYRGQPAPDQHPGEDPLRLLTRWPLIDVDHFRKNPDQYRDVEHGYRHCVELFTSGTTGTPKKIIRDPRAEQLNYAYTEARWRNTAGVHLGNRWVMIGGQLVIPVARRRRPFGVAAFPMNQLYMSSYHLQPEFARDYMTAIKRWNPVYLLGYASSLNMLAKFAQQTGITLNLKSIISNAEPLYESVRARLESTFGCKVFDTYGGTEGAFLGFECAHGRMHISPDFGVFEILRENGSECVPGEVGRVVVTGLTNRAMPLIRYPNGDAAAWAEPGPCRCGSSFPVIEHIEGRTDDLIELPNGRLIGRLDPVFKAEFPLREAQIVQKRDDSIEVLIVKDSAGTVPENGTRAREWTPEHEIALIKELRARIGEGLPIRVKYVERIPRSGNNKFKAVVREH